MPSTDLETKGHNKRSMTMNVDVHLHRTGNVNATGKKIALLLLILMIAVLSIFEFAPEESYAEERTIYTNPQTGYAVIVDDKEDLLTDAEEADLVNEMMPITEYGNVAFVSGSGSGTTAERFANDWYYSHFGNDSGTIFVIDMYNRMIQISSAGSVYNVITKGYANTITDNVYTYATRGDYYGCAVNAFRQAYTLLEGGRIARPMKHITNALVALTLAIVVTYFLARRNRKPEAAPEQQIFAATTASTLAASVTATKVIETITYEEVSSSSGGGSGGGFSGGGFSGGGFSGGGGGFSGGGGGHSF